MFQKDLIAIIRDFFDSNTESLNIAIQIPDKFVPDTLKIHDWFTSYYPSKFFFIVSDSSFNDCCVDHISAKHLDADAIIHFGPCCSTNYSIPVCFLPDFDHIKVLDESMMATIENFVQKLVSKNFLVILDQVDISTAIFEKFCADEKFILKFANRSNDCQNCIKVFDFYIPFDSNQFTDTSLIYIGPHEKLATDLGCIFYNHDSLRIDSKSFRLFECSISRELTKRCSLIDSISSFDHVGIIVENPNVRLHVETAQYLQNICAANDIFADIVYVGRLNEMKIGNFADIEFFIHLSCAGRPIFHFVKPIVSPLEFICAKFDVNFWENQILRDYSIFLNFCDQHERLFLQNNSYDNSLSGQLVLKNFFELSTQLINSRKNSAYNGLEINSIDKEMKLYKGAIGNSTAYDYESKE